MLILDTTTKTLEIVLAGAVTANNLPVTASYVDITSSAFTAIAADTISNGTTAVTIVAAPAASTQRQVKSLTVQNADTVAATVTIRLNDNSTIRPLLKVIMNPNDTISYNDSDGFFVMDGNGCIKQNSTYPVSPANTLVGNSLGSSASPTNLTLGTHLAFSGTNLVVGTSGVTAGTLGGTALIPQLTIDAQGIITAGTTVPQYVSLEMFYQGTYATSEVLFQAPLSIPLTIGSSFTSSSGTALVASTGTGILIFEKNGATFGTMKFPISSVGTFSGGTTTSFAIGDVLTIAVSGTADSTLAGVGISIQGTKA